MQARAGIPGFALARWNWLAAGVLALCMLGSVCQAGTLAIACTQPSLVSGKRPTLYRQESPYGWAEQPTAATFDSSGRCEFTDLSPGEYAVELYGRVDGELVALKTSAVQVSRRHEIDWKPVRRSLAVKWPEGQVAIRQVTLRRVGPKPGMEWSSPVFAKDVSPDPVWVCPTETYNLFLAGDVRDETAPNKPLDIVHLWASARGSQAWDIKPGKLSPVVVKWDSRVQSRNHILELVYPTTRVRIPDSQRYRLFTNRRLVAVKYEYQLPEGMTVAFRPRYFDLRTQRTIVLGSPIAPHAWALPMTEDQGGDKPRQNEVVWGVTWQDETGHELNASASRLTLTSEATADGIQWSKDRILVADEQAAIRAAQGLRVRAACPDFGVTRDGLPVEANRTFSTPRFNVTLPECWGYRATCYALKLERVHHLLQTLTGRPGPERVTIHWQSNTHSAWALVGGQHTWMLMPFRSVDSDSVYTDAPIVVHEMLHNFGYPHGEEMAQRDREGNRAFDLFQWWAEDHPEYMVGDEIR